MLRAAILTGNDRRAVAAVILDLAVKRKIRLLATRDTRTPASAKTDAPLAAEIVDDAVFTADETAVLAATFGPREGNGRVRRLTRDRRAVARGLRRLFRAEERAMRDDGLIGPDREWPTRLIAALALLGILSSVVMFAVTWGDVLSSTTSVLAAGACIASIALAPSRWRRYRAASTRVREHLDGMDQYIALAEADRLRFLQSPGGALRTASGLTAAGASLGLAAAPALPELDRLVLNERLLPYAVLFGHGDEWIAELGALHDGLERREIIADSVGSIGEVLDAVHVVGSLAQLAFQIGETVDATGNAVEFVGGLIGGFADIG